VRRRELKQRQQQPAHLQTQRQLLSTLATNSFLFYISISSFEKKLTCHPVFHREPRYHGRLSQQQHTEHRRLLGSVVKGQKAAGSFSQCISSSGETP